MQIFSYSVNTKISAMDHLFCGLYGEIICLVWNQSMLKYFNWTYCTEGCVFNFKETILLNVTIASRNECLTRLRLR